RASRVAVDGWGMPVAAYSESAEIDRRVMEAIHRLTLAEVDSADRGHRRARGGLLDLIASIAVRDWKTAERLARDDAQLANTPGAGHLMAKRGDVEGVSWLLDNGADPSAPRAQWHYDVA